MKQCVFTQPRSIATGFRCPRNVRFSPVRDQVRAGTERRFGPRLCKKGIVSAPRAEHRRYSCAETQFLLESILRTPGTLPGASAGIDLNAQLSSAQVARASSRPATPMIAMTRLML